MSSQSSRRKPLSAGSMESEMRKKPASAGSSESESGRKPASAGSRSVTSSKSRTSSAGSTTSRGSTGSKTSEVRSAPGSGGPVGTARSTGSNTNSKKKVSDRLNPKTIDPFAPVKNTSAFVTLYSSGGVPCRLVHGSVKHKLRWDPIPEDVSFDPVLVMLAEGVRETVHPYMFVARQGFKELLEVSGARDKTLPLVARVVPPIRAALSHADQSVFEAGLDALLQLSVVIGCDLNPHLKTLLVAVGKRALDKKQKDRIFTSLQQLESNGGKDALLQIKAKVPTYQSVS